MTEIYLIRHTQAEGNIFRVMQGHWDGDVTPLGLLEIEALGKRFRDVHLDAVYSSDLYRAYLTALAVAKGNGLDVIKEKRLRELNMGPWERSFFGNLMWECPEKLEAFLTSPWNWNVSGAETLQDVAERAVEAVDEFAGKHDGESIAIVTHGVTIRCLLTRLLGLPTEGSGIAPIVKNTAVSRLVFENGQYSADYLNDISHLGDMPVPDWVQRDGLRHEEFDPSSDPAFYKYCYRDAWEFSHHGDKKGFSAEAYYASAVKHFGSAPGSLLRFYRNEKPAGIIELDVEHGKNAGYGWISLLYLLPEFRFQGYGVQALGRAIMEYHRLGRHAVRLHVAAENSSAIRFYEKNGFQVLSSEPGANGPLLLMERSLERSVPYFLK